MQLIWVAGPAGKVVKLSITTRTVALLVVGLATSLLLLGFVFHWVGWRVAIEYVPELAHRLGGVTSQSEQEKLEATYRAKLEHLDQQLLAVSEHLKKLEDTKNQVLGRVGLTKLLSLTALDKADLGWGQGGPLNLLPRWGATQWQLDRQLDQSLHQAQRMEQSLAQVQTRWDQDLDRLRQVPTQLPVAGEFMLTSSFGYRLDPFTRLPSLHEGIDFVAPVGTPVLATADGKVLRSGFSGAYGEMVDVLHADGFVSRYAHLSRRHVNEGDKVERGQLLGLLGNTGRSTGPHLHYEVMYQGQAMHPAKAFAAWARLNLKP